VSEPPETIASGDGGALASTAGDGDEAYCAACGQSYPLEQDICPKDGSRLAKLKARPDALLGRVFEGRYEVRTSLGQGGMGTVYRGWQISVDREVAIKVIHPKLASDRIAVKRFLREARLASRLSQPGIVNVYDFGQTDDGILYLVMELLRGHTLARELQSLVALPVKRVTTIALQLCDALDVAHAQGIVHRDLKPGNIVILDDPPGRDLIKVLDFGLAKSLVSDTSSVVTHSSAIIGTPLYMAPEQIEGKSADQRADLYALGCILYHMVSGRPPFVADTVNQVLAMHLDSPPAPLAASIPVPLARAIEQLMQKDPGKRLASAAAARTGIETAIAEGHEAPEIADTTPDASDHLPAELLALAATRPAVSAPDVEDAPVVKRRPLVPLIAVVVLLGVIAVFLIVRDRDRVEPRAAATPVDAAAQPTAAPPPPPPPPPSPVIVDAAPPPADAAAPPADARQPRPKPPKRDAGTASTPPPVDAGLEFIESDGGR
jgi:eukaryotic-like serine/threonine-protein kinase